MCFKGGSKGRTVCLLGLSNSGKTLLYMRVSGEFFNLWECNLFHDQVMTAVEIDNDFIFQCVDFHCFLV